MIGVVTTPRISATMTPMTRIVKRVLLGLVNDDNRNVPSHKGSRVSAGIVYVNSHSLLRVC
jgi:hypothetical protein